MCWVGGGEFEQYKEFLEIKNITVRMKNWDYQESNLNLKIRWRNREKKEQKDKEIDKLREKELKLEDQFERPASN